MKLKTQYQRLMAQLTLFVFLANSFVLPVAHAQEITIPAPGVRIALSPAFNPPTLKGLKVHPDNPFRFDFILDKGDEDLSSSDLSSRNSGIRDKALKSEAQRLIKYFLASLTVPEQDLWVNLSPYEKDRIVPTSFGQTEMGRDVRKAFETALRKSDIINFRFHDLRHTFASQLVMCGVDLNTVRELLGHKDLTMTLRYSHLAASHKQRAVDVLGSQIDTQLTHGAKAENFEVSHYSELIENQLVTI